MLRRICRLALAARAWHPRDAMIGIAGAGVVALPALVSIGFGTFALYATLAAAQGPAVAAILLAGLYAVAALGLGFAFWRRQAGVRRAATPAALPQQGPDGLDGLLRGFVTSGLAPQHMALLAAMQGGPAPSLRHLLLAALLGGFLLGGKGGRPLAPRP